MQIIFLSPVDTLLLDVAAWVLFHVSIGFCSSRIPAEWLDPNKRFYQSFSWEKGGKIYQCLFRVRSWKRFIPDGSRLYRNAFSLQTLRRLEPVYLERWLKESVRAELCHWLMIFPSGFFFLWNSTMVGWVMVLYAALNNFFPIVMQRFNRPRIRRFLERFERTPVSIAYPYVPAAIDYEAVGSGLAQ